MAAVSNDPLSSSLPATRALYELLLRKIKAIGPFQIETKKTSIHLTRKSAFAGVHPRKQLLILTVKSDHPIDSERIAKAEQVSKSRWHLDLRVAASSDIDEELLGWLRSAYELCG
jgi:hypothetical protein